MSDIPILPNPFKMLDLEREKKMKLTDDKCNSCNDEKKEGFNNLKKDKPIVEGMELEQYEEGWMFAVVLFVASAAVFISSINSEWIINEIIEDINFFKISTIVVLICFILFAYIALALHTNESKKDEELTKNMEDKNNRLRHPYVWIPIVVGLIMSLFRFVPKTDDVPALIGYFENTVGHFMFLIFNSGAGLNKWIRSDNFETLINNGDGKVTKDFNPLMSIFNLNNYKKIIGKMRFEDGTAQVDEENTSDFFVTLEHENGIKTKEDFINYIRKKVIMKRTYGEVTLLIITTLISTGILQSVYH